MVLVVVVVGECSNEVYVSFHLYIVSAIMHCFLYFIIN